ncbi:hypothetical protein BJ508DRAFT_322567 [Ascobolus immersus RN42]|uniref:Uncharacterized protein n=1 Tax=Ascobolus immersus RN42 TaxID=1160509 RepID=A0A3N4IHA5_ASCIM|nr:hypothetical protein BJ508DRAFT_322567 [Ascobolus immersus RN42]
MSNTLQFTTISHPHQFPKFRGGTNQDTRRMEDSCLHHQQHQQHLQLHQQLHQQHHHDSMRTLSSITTKLTPMSPRDNSTMVAAADTKPQQSSGRPSFSSSIDMSSSASSAYSSEAGSHVSSAPTTPVSDSISVPFTIDLKTVDEKIGEALATPKASAVPKPLVEEHIEAQSGDEDDSNAWGDYDSDESDDSDGSEWETESSGHEAEDYSDDDCGIEFGHSDDEEEDEDEDDGLFGYDSAEEDDVSGSDNEEGHDDDVQLPTLPNVDAHRTQRPPLRPCLSHAQTSQPMKRSESTGSRVRFSETAERPQVIQTRVFMYSYYEFDSMVSSDDCPNEIRSAFQDKRTEMEKFRELQALKEFYISLLDPTEREKERAKPEFEIIGRMEHFLLTKMIEEKGEDVFVENPEKCAQLLVGIGFGSLKLGEEEKKDFIKKRREGTVAPTASPAETPTGSDGEWETDYETDEEA